MTVAEQIRVASYLRTVVGLRGVWRHTDDLVGFAAGRSRAVSMLYAEEHPAPPPRDTFDDAITNEYDTTISGIGHPRMPARKTR